MRLALPVLAVALVAGCGTTHPVAEQTAAPSSTPPSHAPTGPTTEPATVPATLPATGSSPTPRTARPSVTAATTLPAFRAAAAPVTAASLGATYHPGCPTAPVALRLLRLSFVDFAGHAETGTMVVNEAEVTQVEHVFAELYAERFPIRRMVPVSAYAGSDEASVAADNTAGFNCRDAVTAGGAPSWSMHAYGDAIDVDPVENPYIYGGRVDPADGAAYTDRSDRRPGMAYVGSPLNSAFAEVGWFWGASFDDYQHFSTNGK